MPTRPCRKRHPGHDREDVCAEDGWPCPQSGPGVRLPAWCPRFTPARAPCPVCLDPEAPHRAPLLLAESSGLEAGVHYACPSCGYRADQRTYARDMLLALGLRATPGCASATIPCLEGGKK